MQTTVDMDEARRAPRVSGDSVPLRVVIAYDCLAAGKRAMRVIGDLAKALGNTIEFEPTPWSFDLLADVDWREVAASDAVRADILIIATSGARPVPSEVERWTEAAIQRKQGTAAAVVALFGAEEDSVYDRSPQLAFVQNAAREAGLDFFAPAPRRELDEALAAIHRRSQMVTPLLAGILAQQPKPGPSRLERNP